MIPLKSVAFWRSSVYLRPDMACRQRIFTAAGHTRDVTYESVIISLTLV